MHAGHDSIAGAYNFTLLPVNTPAVVQAHAIALSDKLFHRNLNPAEPSVIGNYTHPYIGRAIYFIYFVGLIPVGTRFKSEFKVMSLATIAYATGLIETFIKCYRGDDLFDTQKKVTMGQIQPDVLKHHQNLLKMADRTLRLCVDLQEMPYSIALHSDAKSKQRCQSKGALGVLEDDDFDEVDLTLEQLAELRNARHISGVYKKPVPTVEQPDNTSDVDANEVQATLESRMGSLNNGSPAPMANGDDEAMQCNSEEEADDSDSVGASKHGCKIAVNGGQSYDPLSDPNEELDGKGAEDVIKSHTIECKHETNGTEGKDSDNDDGCKMEDDDEGDKEQDDEGDKEGDKEGGKEGEEGGGSKVAPAGEEANSQRAQQASDESDTEAVEETAGPVEIDKPVNAGTRSTVGTDAGKVEAGHGEESDEGVGTLAATPGRGHTREDGPTQMDAVLKQLWEEQERAIQAAAEQVVVEKAVRKRAKAEENARKAAARKFGIHADYIITDVAIWAISNLLPPVTLGSLSHITPAWPGKALACWGQSLLAIVEDFDSPKSVAGQSRAETQLKQELQAKSSEKPSKAEPKAAAKTTKAKKQPATSEATAAKPKKP
ncbi:hypothetical protein FRC08_014242 [Ceratobasidium sp. 394]|nr:hypothetical protein FRC08_014242 [Ceratobasidium sp. 394]